jgi:hypothetical protein
MADEIAAKYVLNIEQSDKPMRVAKSISGELKGAVSAKMVSRMKKEAVLCPVQSKQVCFLECFACKNFLRRLKGTVGCKGEP